MNRKKTLHLFAYFMAAIMLPCLVWADFNNEQKDSPKNSGLYTKRHLTNTVKQNKIPLKTISETANDNAPTLYGSLIYYTGWENLDESECDFGIYSFPATSNAEISLVAKTGLNVLTATLTDRYYYTITRSFAQNGSFRNITLTEINTDNWQVNSEVELEHDWSALPLIITYDKTDSKIYALGYSSDWSKHTLNILDPDSGIMTEIAALGEVGVMPNIYTLSVANNGIIYAICSDGNLYSIDKSNAQMTVIGATGLSPAALQSSVFDYSTNTLYWAASLDTGDSKLCTVDVTTGKATIISNFANYEEFVGLFIQEQINPNAPQKVVADFEFFSPGALNGILSYTAPSLTESGSQIKENISLSVKIDDSEVKNISVAPGSAGNIELSFEEGDHTICITASNESGESKKTYLNVYAGIDIPRSVENLKFNISSFGVASLTWDAVTIGAHNGYLPQDKVRYKIIRHDQTIAAESLTETSFSEQLSDEIAYYNYTVIPYIINGNEGVGSTSQTIRYGQYMGLPYYEDFNNTSQVKDLYTFINANNDGDYYTWQCDLNFSTQDNVLIYYCSFENSADDYAFTPPFKFDSKNLYRMRFKHTANDDYSTFVNKLKILAGKEPTIDAMTTELAHFANICNESGDTEIIFSVPDDDIYYIAFYIYSDAAESSFWINDLNISLYGAAKSPDIVDFMLTLNNIDNKNVVDIDFTAPSKDAAGNSLESLNEIAIYRDNETSPIHKVSNPEIGKKYQWTDDNPNLGNTHYTIIASNQHGDSQSATQSIFVGGYLPPYVETFSNIEDFNLFTIINANNDDETWTHKNGTAYWVYNISYAADDWLISPEITLNSNRVYKVSFKGKSTEWAKENLRFTIGKGINTDNHTTLVDLQDWSTNKYETHSAYFIPETSGNHNIGLYAYSKKATNSITIDEISLIDAMPASAPGSVTNLCAIADATGALSVKISFDAPTTDAKGNPLNELSKIEIYRNNDAIPAYTIESPTKGEEISWIDNNAIEGYNTYKIIPYDNQSNGIDVMCNIYVGFDIPSVVENLNIVGDATNSNCTLSWQAPMTGVNGGVVDTQSLSYNIYREENGVFKEIAINHSEQSFTDNVDHTGEQQIFRYSIKVNSSHGESAELYKNVILGTPYAIPFTENFTSVKTATTPWSFEATSYSSLSLTDYSSIGSGYNNDNGMVQFYKWEDTNDLVKAEMISPKINLNESLNPYVSFYIYHFASSNPTNYIQPYIISEDSEVIPLGEKILIKGEQNGWVKYSYPLTGFTDKRFINFVFDMETSEYSSRIFFDNFCIDDVLDHNLMLESFEGNEIIEIDGATYNVCIRNKGTLTSEQFEVKLFCNDQLIKSVTDSGLEAESTKTYEFTIDAPHISECGQERNLYAEISYDKDMKNTDNISQIINAVVYTPPYPVISDLEGSAVDYTTTLTWSQPSNILYNPVSDSFESYKLFAIDNIGNWTLTDLDKQRTISPRYGVTFTDAFSPKAWQVIDPQRINLYGTDVAPHSGYMCLFSMQSDGSLLNGTTTDVCNDDWLISPEIVGGSELKFWAMQPTMNYGGNEKFEVLYSTTDTDTNNFILIEEVELHNMATWNEYIYTLPKDAKHFAIRHTLSFFGLWLDDITYQPSDSFEEMNIDCYNIYRDGEQIGTSDINSYKDKGLEIGTYQYAVTTNFADYGESALSNTIDVEVKYSSVANINSGKHIVYSANGHIVIADANGESVAVYTSDGKTVARSIAVDNISISVEPGIYIVTIDSSTYKIIAK